MSRQAKPIRSDIAWSTTDRITVRGRDLPGQILGHMNLGEFAFFQLIGQEPTPQQSAVFNAIIITLVEHGLTPSAIAARPRSTAHRFLPTRSLGSELEPEVQHLALTLRRKGRNNASADLERLGRSLGIG